MTVNTERKIADWKELKEKLDRFEQEIREKEIQLEARRIAECLRELLDDD